MKLDSRIKSLSDILTCFDIEKAKQFIGQKGYFALKIGHYKCLDSINYGTLAGVSDDDTIAPFKECNIKEGNLIWDFFIPESKLLEIKKKEFRPYTFMEFTEKFIVGKPIKFRKKGEKKDEWISILIGYWEHQIEDEVITYILIGHVQYTLDELFEEYEWQEHYTEDFEPFGVEEWI